MTTPVCFTPQDEIKLFVNDPSLQRLAWAVIIQAAKEAAAGCQEAAAWLANPETADTWLSLAELDSRAVLAWVEAGCKSDLNKNGRYKARHPESNVDSGALGIS